MLPPESSALLEEGQPASSRMLRPRGDPQTLPKWLRTQRGALTLACHTNSLPCRLHFPLPGSLPYTPLGAEPPAPSSPPTLRLPGHGLTLASASDRFLLSSSPHGGPALLSESPVSVPPSRTNLELGLLPLPWAEKSGFPPAVLPKPQTVAPLPLRKAKIFLVEF